MTSGAHELYKKVAVGGSFINPTNQHISVNGKVYYGKNKAWRVNYNGGSQKINDLSEADVDWAHLEWLARNLKASNIGGKKVFVETAAKANGACFDLYDFNKGGQGYDRGNTLVVFNTDDDLCFKKTHDGRQFGPSILAPFSKVTVNNAGFVDGIVIAKEFTTVKGTNKGGELQLHGDTYDGSIECIEAPAPSSVAKSAAAPDSDVCSCEQGDDSDQSWRCGTAIYACPSVDDVCKGQTRKKSLYYKLTQEQCNAMKNVAIGEQCVSLPQYGINKGKTMGSRVCYGNQTLGPNGIKEEDEQCKICWTSLTPTFQ